MHVSEETYPRNIERNVRPKLLQIREFVNKINLRRGLCCVKYPLHMSLYRTVCLYLLVRVQTESFRTVDAQTQAPTCGHGSQFPYI